MSTPAHYGVYVPTYLSGTPLGQVWLDAWVETNDPNQAAAAVQRHALYEQYFPGNLNEDGSVKYTEAHYKSIVDSFDDTLLSVNLNPDLFRHRYGELIRGLVSPAEFGSRVDQVYEGLLDQAPEIKEFYADRFGVAMTDEAILASLLDPDLDEKIASGQIAISQVGGSAAQKGFTVAVDFARSLVHAGMDTTSEAAQFFSLAEGAIPVLTALAARHADPDDDFDLADFAAASVFNDPEQRQRTRRLLAQERASFSRLAGGPVAISRETGAQSGLETR